MNALGVRFSYLGRPEEALTASQEAVDIKGVLPTPPAPQPIFQI